VRSLSVVVTDSALREIKKQAAYIAKDSPDNAIEWNHRVRGAISRLADYYGHAVDDAASKKMGFEIRKTVFEGTYLIYYPVDQDDATVRVLHFRHGARRPYYE
jgi:plasmid stabilization system protein ParE